MHPYQQQDAPPVYGEQDRDADVNIDVRKLAALFAVMDGPSYGKRLVDVSDDLTKAEIA